MRGPTAEQPRGAGEFDGGVWPFDRCSIYLPQHCVCKSGCSPLLVFYKLDGLMDGCVRRDTVQIAQLKDGRPQSDINRPVEIGCFPARIKKNQMIQLGLISQTAENDLRSKGCITCIE
jgi:hypothetical protein